MKRFTGALVAGGVLMAALPAAAQSVIRPGETVGGSLTASDRRLDDGSSYDCFRLQAAAGERISVTLRSNAFDAYLAVVEGRDCATGDSVETDDDGGGGTDSLIRVTLGGGPSSLPSVRPLLIGASEMLEGDLAEGDAIADDDSFFDCYAFDARAGQTATIAMLSEEFDAYLSLHAGEMCDSQIDSNDDGFDDGTDALIEHRFERTGRYSFRANSLGSGDTGAYGLVFEIQ